MNEKLITIEGIDPLELYGVNNALFDRMKDRFPKLKIVARGSDIKVFGSSSEIHKFENKLDELLNLYTHHGRITEEHLLSLFEKTADPDKDAQSSLSAVILYGTEGRIIQARTPNQKKLVTAYANNDLLFAIGPAGSGKTYTAIALAVKSLKNKEVKRIILARPAVEAGERLGFLPGDMKEKLDPYLQPLYDALHDMIPGKKLQSYIEDGTVQIAPLAYMRGRTLDSACVILDEAQNTTSGQLKMFLTRMGASAKFIVTGDATQVDLPRQSDSGLLKTMELLKKIKGIGIITFDKNDIVRHPLVKHIVNAFEPEK